MSSDLFLPSYRTNLYFGSRVVSRIDAFSLLLCLRYPSRSNMEAICANTCLFKVAGSKFLKLSVRIVILSLVEFQFNPRTLNCDSFISFSLKTLVILAELDFYSLIFVKISLNFFLLMVYM